ncbi:hypothetical protein [Dictyobacter vulcani]|uniref:hypothetical protein n=1 Tax=Dictyobacter vulcani TaxID=2607529 RepID=UPI00124F7D4A|nr:hypothetical protein [Dictyobacter vulcani]
MDDNTRSNMLGKIRSFQSTLSYIAISIGICCTTFLCISAIENKIYGQAISYGFLTIFEFVLLLILIFINPIVSFLIKQYESKQSSQEKQSNEQENPTSAQ